jgi:hypothetical protein
MQGQRVTHILDNDSKVRVVTIKVSISKALQWHINIPNSIQRCRSFVDDLTFFGMDQRETVIYTTLFAITSLLTIIAMFGVSLGNWLRIKNYSRMTFCILLLSLIHAIIGYVQNTTKLQSFERIWTNWFLSMFGISTMIVYLIAQIELLFLFSPIAPYWAGKRAYCLQVAAIPFMLLLNFPTYTYPIISVLQGTLRTLFSQVKLYNVVVYLWYDSNCWHPVNHLSCRDILSRMENITT